MLSACQLAQHSKRVEQSQMWRLSDLSGRLLQSVHLEQACREVAAIWQVKHYAGGDSGV